MAANRQLWTAPFGRDLAGQALAIVPAEASGLWIVPTPRARERALRALVLRGGSSGRLRVWTWADLWAATRARSPSGPALLSEAGVRAALGHCIEEAARADELSLSARVADTVGFRRQLRARVAAWTRRELDPAGEPPGVGVVAEQWAVFGRYRSALNRLGSVDREAFAAWASWTLKDDPPPDLRRFGFVTLLDVGPLDRAAWRAVALFEDRAAALLIALHYEEDDRRPDLFRAVAPTVERLRQRHYAETPFEPDDDRPAALRRVGRRLFRASRPKKPLESTEGLHVLGGPEGEGVGLLAARRVRELLANGSHPDDIAVLVPCWDDAAETLLETLQSWGVPAVAERPRPPACEPAVAALRRAIEVPAGGWDAVAVVELLRNGQVRPEGVEPLALASAATEINEARAFRGRDEILGALRSAAAGPARGDDEPRPNNPRAERARAALPIVEPLFRALDAADRRGPWADHVGRLRTLAGTLGLPLDGPAPDGLFLALDEHGAVLDGLGQGERLMGWAEFGQEVAALARTWAVEPAPAPSGAVRVATVDEAAGTRARHVLLANLAEGTFPARQAVVEADPQQEVDPEVGTADRAEVAYSREMLRFLRVVGMADESLALLYPTRDDKGQELLAAGFFDDVRRLFAPSAWRPFEDAALLRVEPVPPPELAGSAADLRVLALARACLDRDDALLRRLAADPAHRPALLGAASALRVAHDRGRRRAFGPYDGMLRDPAAAARLAADFGPGRPAFSPSQVESLAFCPFQFFQKYVLRLAPADRRDELDEDRTARGSLIHEALETLHRNLHDTPADPGEPLADRVAAAVEEVIARLMDGMGTPRSDVDRGLRRIDQERLLRTGRRYAQQFRRYAAKDGAGATCAHFEFAFGKEDEGSPPPLLLGDGPDAVRLQGVIDRVDVIERGGRAFFRVIDYKTGACPGKAEVEAGIALQLPLYALAVESLVLGGREAAPLDVGYWALRGNGFKCVQRMARLDGDGVASDEDGWPAYRAALEAYVRALVDHLRRGSFPVRPRTPDCTRNCDYRTVCRIAQVRLADKRWDDAPRLEAGR